MHRSRPLVVSALVLGLLFLALPALAEEGAARTVNINAASVEQLQLLPHVGPSVAQRIVDYREKNGPFKSTHDLMLVRGIGEKTFELLEPYLSISGATTLSEKVKVPRQPTDSSTR